MKPDAIVVGRLRQAVRAAVQTSAALRRDYRKPPGWIRRHRAGSLSFRWLVPPMILFSAWMGAPRDLLLGYASLWTLAVTFSRGRQLMDLSHAADQLWPYYQMPVANATVASLQRSRWTSACRWLAADWLALGFGLALHEPRNAWGWVLLPFLGVAQAAVAAALAAWLVRSRPTFPHLLGQGLTAVLFFLCIQGWENPTTRAACVLPILKGALVLTPGGWLGQMHSLALAGAWPAALGLVMIAILATLLIRPALDTFWGRFQMEPLFGYNTSTLPTVLPRPESMPMDEEHALDPVDPAALPKPDRVTLRARLAEQLTTAPASALLRGPLESTIRGLLSARQRILIDAFRPQFVWGWSRSWCLALGLILVSVLLRLAPLGPAWSISVTTGALGLFALPVFTMMTSGFAPVSSFQANTGRHSYLPIGFWECAGLFLRISLLRSVAAIPLVVLGLRYGYTSSPLPWLAACDWSLRVLIFVMALQPIWVITAFSSTTNDVSSRWWFTVLLGSGMALGLVDLVITAVAMAGIPELGYSALVGGQFAVLTYTLLVGYGLAYRFNVFDLLNRPRPTDR
jgi:hypothetical protein